MHPGTQYFPASTTHLVHDPTSVLREGDIVRIAAGWRVSRRKRHVVTEVVAAFGGAVEERRGEGAGERRGLVGLEELVRERERRREERRRLAMGERGEVEGEGQGEGVVV